MAVLLKHHDLGHVVASLLEHGPPECSGIASQKHGLPRSIAEIIKFVNATKLSLIKVVRVQDSHVYSEGG